LYIANNLTSLLGPTAFGGNATNPLIPLSSHAETFQTILNAFGIYEFLPNFLEIKSWLAHTICGMRRDDILK
jgi:hypothetical protein